MLTVVAKDVVPKFTNSWQRLAYNVSYWTWSKHKKPQKINDTKTWMSGFETTLPFLRTLMLSLTECATKKLSKYDMHKGNRFLFPKEVFQIMEVCLRARVHFCICTFVRMHIRELVYCHLKQITFLTCIFDLCCYQFLLRNHEPHPKLYLSLPLPC